MASITQIVSKIKNPATDYISLQQFTETNIKTKDSFTFSGDYNVQASLVGLAVDYTTRVIVGQSVEKAFHVPVLGAGLIGKYFNKKEKEKAEAIINRLNDLAKANNVVSDEFVNLAIKMSAFDCGYRRGPDSYVDVDEINPDENTVKAAKTFIERTKNFFKDNGPIVECGGTFEGGNTDKLDSGDCDFVTKDCLWDLKTSKNKPKTTEPLQVLAYYIAGIRSNKDSYKNIKKVGIYNPVLSKSWTINISDIDDEVFNKLESQLKGKDRFQSTRDESLRWDVIDWIRETSETEVAKGKKFERASKFFLTNSPVWTNRLSDVWLWDDPENPLNNGKDIGIDIVAKDKYDKSYWAIQCKCYDERKSLDYGDVSTFYGTTGADLNNYKHNMIITTCETYSTNLETVANQWKTVRIGPSDLLNPDLDWDAFKEGKISKKREIFKPRKHQDEAIKACIEGFKDADRGKLIMACGTGKTLTSLRFAEKQCPKGFVLFLAPSISLVSQALNYWSSQAENPIKCAVVCSDKKASKTSGDTWDTALSDIPFPATTDVNELLDNLTKNENKDGLTAIFSTYQSIDVIIDAQKKGLPDFDLCICDEAHRTTGAKQLNESKENESAFTKVHNANILKANKRLYMTATPRIYGEKAKKVAREESYEISSMDDKAKYGEEFYRLAFDKAVEMDLLSDYKVLVLGVSEDFVSTLYQSSMFQETDSFSIPEAAKVLGCWKGLATKGKNTQFDDLKKDVIEDVETAVSNSNNENPMKRAVVFTQKIKESKDLAAQFQNVMDVYKEKTGDDFSLDVEIDHVDGTQSSDLRKKKLRWLADEPNENTCRILSNAKCLSEGIDVPNLDAILFMKPRKSKIDIVQAVGRVMRKAEGKEYGYIILPVVIPSGMTPEEALNDSKAFEVVWEVLQGLRSHDERLEAEINALQFDDEEKGTERITIDLLTEDSQEKQTEIYDFYQNIKEWDNALEVQIVKKCGTRVYWDDWAEDVADIAKRHIKRITALVENDKKSETEFNKFLKGLQDSLNPSVSKEDAIEMLAQHMITLPIFEALFGDASFVRSNPVSIAMEKMLDVLQRHHIEEQEDDIKLQSLYDSVKRRVAFIESDAGRQKLIKELYEKFFSCAFKSTSEKMGIVYTPNEIVDYILYTTDRVLKKEFGEGLGSKNVHILDPFAGTGTFMANLISSDIISDEDIEYKYEHEMHSNEILLLAYYIMVINIEQAYHNRVGGEYKEFKGAVLTDTFQMTEEGDTLDLEIFTQNSDRVVAQNRLPIKVIVGNPPYSAGQNKADDSNQNEYYPTLERRIKSTYVKSASKSMQASTYNTYVKAFRWSTDRIGDNGIIAFVSDAGWLRGKAANGIRQCVADEFQKIYILDLRGDMWSPNWREEGGQIFGSGCKSPICITVFIKNNKHRNKCEIFYKSIGNGLSRQDKLNAINNFIDEGISDWENLTLDKFGDWLDKRDESWYDYPPLGLEKHKGSLGLFTSYTSGIISHRDSWVFNYSTKQLANNINTMFNFYNSELGRCDNSKKAEDVVKRDPTKIKWDKKLYRHFDNGKVFIYDKNKIRTSLYRPYCKQNVYYDRDILWSTYRLNEVFPQNKPFNNVAICCTGPSDKHFSCLITKEVPEFLMHFNGYCFPKYLYKDENFKDTLFEDNKDNSECITDSITDKALETFRSVYPEAFKIADRDKRNNKAKARSEKDGGVNLNKDDIFYYIYGILHSPEYKKRYELNLQKEIPRIPLAEEFVVFSKAGRKLADLHLNYENVEPWAAISEEGDSKNPGKTIKMRFGKCSVSKDNPKGIDMSTIHVSENLTLKNIPLQAYDYIVNGKSAIGWIIDRYQIRTDKASGIVNDPNEYSDNPRYIVDLLKSIVTVSIRTNEIISSLPPLKELPQPADWPFEWKAQE